MRFMIAILLLLIPASAMAQIAQPSCFKRVSSIASKLKIKAMEEGKSNGMAFTLQGCDGKNYDVLQLLEAIIDKMDRASRK